MSSEASSPPDPAAFVEQPAWEAVRGTWRPVHGGIFQRGFSLEWHEFHLATPLDWAKSFHEDALEICLNFGGEARMGSGKTAPAISAGQLLCYAGQHEARREPGSLHRFYTLEVTAEFLRTLFGAEMDRLRPAVVRFLEKGGGSPGFFEPAQLPAMLLPLRMQLLEPPVFPGAQATWYQGKIFEVLSATVFREGGTGELFCSQHKRLNRERVEQVRFLLERDMEQPPSLDMLAEQVGCSAFHLSRIFSQECGMSIPKYLRTRRMEKAAELLRSGGMTVTEAAMAVGYASLSAFIKAFLDQHGVLPSHYASGDRKG